MAAAMLLLIQGVAGQTCGLSASTLSTSCNDACEQYEPCVAFSALACPSEASCVTDYGCAIQCFSEPLNDPKTFTFLVDFGSSQTDETDTYASASNDAVSNISTIELQPTTTSLSVKFGWIHFFCLSYVN